MTTVLMIFEVFKELATNNAIFTELRRLENVEMLSVTSCVGDVVVAAVLVLNFKLPSLFRIKKSIEKSKKEISQICILHCKIFQ